MKQLFKLHVGDLINYRIGLVKVLKIEDDGVVVKGDGGLEQKLDWEDVKQYNPRVITPPIN